MNHSPDSNNKQNTDQLIADLTGKDTPVEHSDSSKLQLARVIISLVLYSTVIFLITPARQDLTYKLQNHFPYLVEIIVLTILAATSLYAALTSAYPDFRGKKRISLAAFAISATVTILYYGALLFKAPEPIIWGEFMHGFSCCIHIAAIAFIPAFILSIFIKRLAGTELVLTGLLVASFAFAFAAALFRTIEPIDWMGHIFLWHYFPLALFALIGAWLGPKLYRW